MFGIAVQDLGGAAKQLPALAPSEAASCQILLGILANWRSSW